MPEGSVRLEDADALDHRLEELLVAADPALAAAVEESESAGLPPISVTPLQGKLLHLLARMVGARRILEIGTLGGYSTIWLARALPDGGSLLTLEVNPHHADVARSNVARAGLAERVEVRLAPALESLEALLQEGPEPFDFVFLDADKRNNPRYLQMAIRLSHPGTVIVVDNVGRRAAPGLENDPDVAGTLQVLTDLGSTAGITATAIQTVGAKGHDGFALAIVDEVPSAQ